MLLFIKDAESKLAQLADAIPEIQPLALYVVNSIFTSGYLTTQGATPSQDHEMIRDMGFEIEAAGGRSVPMHLPIQGAAHGQDQSRLHPDG